MIRLDKKAFTQPAHWAIGAVLACSSGQMKSNDGGKKIMFWGAHKWKAFLSFCNEKMSHRVSFYAREKSEIGFNLIPGLKWVHPQQAALLLYGGDSSYNLAVWVGCRQALEKTLHHSWPLGKQMWLIIRRMACSPYSLSRDTWKSPFTKTAARSLTCIILDVIM